MKITFLLFLSLSPLFISAQNVIDQDSVIIYRTKLAWKERDTTRPALFLPPISYNAGRKAVVRSVLLPAAITAGVFVTEASIYAIAAKRRPIASNSDSEGIIPFASLGTGLVAAGYVYMISPLKGNLAYKDKKRAWIGLGLRLAGIAVASRNEEPFYTAGGVLYFGGIVYNLATIPLSRRDYQARLQQYEIYD